MAARARASPAPSSSSVSMNARAPRPRSTSCCATSGMTAQNRNEPLDAVALAAELIRSPSVTPNDAGAIPHLAAVLGRLGFTCHQREFHEPGSEKVLNLYARYGKGGRNLCFAGHTDVVPPGDVAAWTIGPFAGTVEKDALHGRGAVDMKGAIA